MTPFDLFPPWIALIALFGVGRVVLSLLPPGRPGGHTPAELPATWAASHVLGLVAFAAEWEWLAVLDLAPPSWWLLAPWILVAVVRVALLPGAVVPRHEPAPVPPGNLAWAARALLLAIVARVAWTDDLEAAANLAAVLVLLLEAGRGLRQPPELVAVLVVLFSTGTVIADLPPLLPVLDAAWPTLTLLGTGGLFWIRRADERWLTLALFSAVGCALLDPRLAWVGGLAALALFLASHPAGWRRARGPLAIALVAGAVPLALQDLTARCGWSGLDLLTPVWVAIWTILAGAQMLLGLTRRAPSPRPAREALWAALLATSCVVGALAAEASVLLGLHLALPVLLLGVLTGMRRGTA